MRSCDPSRALKVLPLLLLFCAFAHAPASGQTDGQRPTKPREQQATVILPETRRPAPAARQSEMACAGMIEQASQAAVGQIVGAEQESERRDFGEGYVLFIDAGAQAGVRPGQEFSVVRPRGQFRSKFSRKGGPLGVYTQEVGRVRVLRVRDRVSVVEVTLSCADMLVGDQLRPAQARPVPQARAELALDRFAEPTGKQTGSIVLARLGREMVSRDDVVFVDLGAEDGVKAGDYLTVFRPQGHGTMVKYPEEGAANARRGFESEEFRGGGFSIQAQRVRETNGSKYGETVKTPSVQRHRPEVPRKVVGELVVLSVEGRTATAVVTRIAQEIHTGDAVEVQ